MASGIAQAETPHIDLDDLLGWDPTLGGDLASRPRWVAWKYEGTQKVPVSPHTGFKADATNPANWARRENAEARFRKGGCEGVGIVLGTSGGETLGGVDLDGCRNPETGAIEPWATAIVDLFTTYAEVSPSGTGLKLFFRYNPADLPRFQETFAKPDKMEQSFLNGSHYGPEVHLGARYYAVTGQRHGTPEGLREMPAETLLWLLTEAGPQFKETGGGPLVPYRGSASDAAIEARNPRSEPAGRDGTGSARLFSIAWSLLFKGETFEAFAEAAMADPDARAHVEKVKGKQRRHELLVRQWKRACREVEACEKEKAELIAEMSAPDKLEALSADPPPSVGVGPGWVRNRRGHVVWCHANVGKVLRTYPQWRGVLAHNELTQQIVLTARIPGNRGGRFTSREIRDSDYAAALDWFNRHEFPDATEGTLRAMIDLVARDNVISPVRHYLEDLAWDARPRLDTWLIDHFGADEAPYTRAVGRAWLISAVARALQPGCKADHMLVLEGSQGIGKSTALAALCGPDWFSDSLPDMHSKDASVALRGKWIIEIGEMSAMRRSDVEAVKAFVSRTDERYRPPYGKAEVVEPRRCIFAGTVNPAGDGYLLDDTGGRRFWPVACRRADVAGITAARDQLWAEAVAAFKAGEQWHLTREMEGTARLEQAERAATDPWESGVLKAAEELAAEDTGGAVGTGSILGWLGIHLHERTPAQAKRVAGILTRAGWRRDGRFKERSHPDCNGIRFVRGRP